MGGIILFIIVFFVMLIAVPVISILRLVFGNGRNVQRTQQSYSQQNTTTTNTSSVNKRFDKSKAEDVEFEEVK